MSTPPTPPNPFESWQLGVVSSVDVIPLPVLLQSAITGTVDDQITEHAHNLFATLDERGPDAWREVTIMLIQYILSGGHYGMGSAAADRYMAQQSPLANQMPSLAAMHTAVAAYMTNGEVAAAERLGIVGDEATRGAAHWLFCVAVGASGYNRAKFNDLMTELCADLRP